MGLSGEKPPMVARLPGTPYMEFQKKYDNKLHIRRYFDMKKLISVLLIILLILSISSAMAFAAKKRQIAGPKKTQSYEISEPEQTPVSQEETKQPSQTAISSNNTGFGTWLWNPWLIVSSKDDILNYLRINGYSELYLQIDSTLDLRYYRDFVSSAASYGINVYALSGDSVWIWQDKRGGFYNFIRWVENYNLSVSESEKFCGIHLDVEPYQNAEWNTARDNVILNYQNFVDEAVLQAARLNLPVVFDIPFWFDEIYYSNNYGSGNLAPWVISKTSWTNIMAYRDSSQEIIAIAENEAGYAKNFGKRLVISVETQPSSEGENVTFFEEGLATMYSELSNVKAYFDSKGYTNIGFAVHHLASIMKM